MSASDRIRDGVIEACPWCDERKRADDGFAPTAERESQGHMDSEDRRQRLLFSRCFHAASSWVSAGGLRSCISRPSPSVPQRDIRAARADFDSRNEQLVDAGLLGGKQLSPELGKAVQVAGGLAARLDLSLAARQIAITISGERTSASRYCQPSPAKAAIRSGRAIAEKLTGMRLPCQKSVRCNGRHG